MAKKKGKRITAKQKAARRRNIKVAQASRTRGGKAHRAKKKRLMAKKKELQEMYGVGRGQGYGYYGQ